MRRHMLELGWIYNKACVEETPRPAASHGTKYIINESDMKIILNVIHWNCFICKTECDQKIVWSKWKGRKIGRIETPNMNTSVVHATAIFC